MSTLGNITRRSIRTVVRRLLGRASARAARGVIFESVEARQLMSAVTGFVYNDTDHLGYRDSNEVGLGGQTIYADANYNNQLDAGERSTVSAANGSYTLDNLPVAPFSLRIKPSGDYTQTKPQENLGYYVGVQNGALAPTGSEVGVFTGVVIRGQVFNDANGNGVRDPGEGTTAANAVVTATYKDTNLGQTFADVQADGTYALFAKRSDFTLALNLPDGLTATTPSKLNVTITNGTPSLTTTNFGVRPTATAPNTTVIGTAFIDKNHNGVRDAGEPGVSGGSVGLDDGQSNRGYAPIASDGSFVIGNARGTGQVQLSVGVNGKLVQSNPAFNTTRTVTLNPGTVVNAGDIAFDERAAYLNVSSFDDLNKNGQQDAGEGNVFSFFWIDANGDNIFESGEVPTNGQFVLPAGTYRVAVQFENDKDQYADAVKTVTIDGSTLADVNLKFGRGSPVVTPPPANTSVITGSVYEDANGNGRHDAGEAARGDVRVYADYNYNGVQDADEPSALTNGTTNFGTYTLTVANKPFALRAINLADGTFTAPTGGVYYFSLVNGVPSTFTSAPDFGERHAVTPPPTTTTISGTLYNDQNANGKRDAGEGAAQFLYGTQLRIYADLNGNDQYDAGEPSTYQDLNTGMYTLGGVPVGRTIAVRGDYTTLEQSRLTQPGGFGSDAEIAVTTTASPVTGVDFGFTAFNSATIDVIAFVDSNGNGSYDAGEAPTGTAWIDFDRDGIRDANEPPITRFFSLHEDRSPADLGSVFLAQGTYRVALDTSPNGGDGVADYSQDVTANDLGYHYVTFAIPTSKGTTLPVHVYRDTNANGTIEASEATIANGVAGQTVFADYNYNGVLDVGEDSAVSDASGLASLSVQNKPFQLVLKPASGFTQSSPGTKGVYFYELKNGVPSGYGSTFGVTPVSVTPPTGQSSITLNYFADYDGDGKQTAGVDGGYSVPQFNSPRAYIDTNRDGVFDTGDVEAVFNNFTGGGGYFSFDALAAGTYRLVLSQGLAGGESVFGGATRDITVDGSTGKTVDVPVEGVKYAVLNTNIFFDANADGYQQNGELNPVDENNTTGVFAYVDLNYNGVHDDNEATIGLPNHYGYTSSIALLPGSYSIRVEQNGKPATFAYGATSRWVTIPKPGLYTTQLGIVSST